MCGDWHQAFNQETEFSVTATSNNNKTCHNAVTGWRDQHNLKDKEMTNKTVKREYDS
jgi:uncharacterized protein YeaC (DUF1315 family)